jgi:hypothetical protein
MTTFLVGIGAIVVGVLAFLVALPRRGQVRSFLRNEDVQAYYTVAIIVIVAAGGANLLSAVWLLAE